MACGIKFLQWLSEGGCLPPHGRLLDIGESCLYMAAAEDIRWFWDRYGCSLPPDEYEATLAHYVMRSNTIGHPEIRTLFVAELLAVTNLRYSSIDVVSAGFAERFDMNLHALALAQRNQFDMVVNFGTTEHLINQMNAYRVIHDACKPGGHMYHQVPGTGYLHHGYFTYDIQFFEDLAKANGYVFKDAWYCGPQGAGNVLQHAPTHPGVADPNKPYNNVEGFREQPIPNSVINVLFQKVSDAPFRVGLELSTSANFDTTGQFVSSFIYPASLPPPKGYPVVPIRDHRRR